MKFIPIAMVALSLAIPAVASAGNDKGHGNKHGAHAKAHKGTPPGLAKKPYRMPPGQAKKVWNRGERLPTQYYTQTRYYVTNPSVANLPPAPYGSRWVRVDDHYYLAQTETGAISQIISALLR